MGPDRAPPRPGPRAGPCVGPCVGPCAGFVLAETLAALAISGAVLLGLCSLTNVVSRHARLAFARVEASEADRQGLAALARDIGSAQRLRWAGPPGAQPFVFLGAADSLLFAVESPLGSPQAPARLVQLQSAVTAEGGEVLRAEAALYPAARDIADLVPGPAKAVHRGSRRLRFAYIAAATAKTPEIAVDAWDLPDAMPVAVRLSLEDPETGLAAQSLRVALRVEAEAGCAAPTKGFCSRPADREGDEGVSTAAIVNALQGRRP